MKSDKRQTMAMIGIALLVIAGVIIYIAVSQPKIYEEEQNASVSIQTDNAVSYSSVSSAVNQQKSIQTSSENTQASQVSVNYPVNLNTATVQELMSIDGLGEKRAYAILSYRDEIGRYTDVSQIMNIKGIGESLYAQVSPYLTV